MTNRNFTNLELIATYNREGAPIQSFASRDDFYDFLTAEAEAHGLRLVFLDGWGGVYELATCRDDGRRWVSHHATRYAILTEADYAKHVEPAEDRGMSGRIGYLRNHAQSWAVRGFCAIPLRVRRVEPEFGAAKRREWGYVYGPKGDEERFELRRKVGYRSTSWTVVDTRTGAEDAYNSKLGDAKQAVARIVRAELSAAAAPFVPHRGW